MGSIKCSLRKEVKNDIAKYIDTEFINEAIKEITIYIKTTHKVHIDDSEFNENDIDSKVTLNDGGKFNVYDYTYVKDFIYELSWEGSYVKELEEDNFTEEDKVVVMTDMLAGSVNQKFIPYMSENVFLITGINVPLAMEIVLLPEECINKEEISNCVESAREAMQFVNELSLDTDEDDE